MFRASLCPSSGDQRPCVTTNGVLCWFCWLWLVAVVGRCVVGCEHCEVLASYKTAPHNRYQPHPAEPASTPYAVTHGLFSPKDGHNDARNMLRQKLIINIQLLHLVGFFFSLHTLLTMHGHRNLKLEYVGFILISSYSVNEITGAVRKCSGDVKRLARTGFATRDSGKVCVILK